MARTAGKRAPRVTARPGQHEQALEDDPLWYKDAVIYQLHVRAFFDSDGNGIGDFQGLTSKLDYLQDLGVTALWLLPFYPSPLKDDGYDIADYAGIHPSYGTMPDFKQFLKEAHARGLRVITELVINHTSDQHPWFQRARKAKPDSPWRDWYVWSEDPTRYREARIIFKDFEHSNWAWDHVAGAYYWHRFYSHQPDLNFANPKVREAVARVMERWFRMGVDGMRLDAIPYLFEREGTNCENLPETHEALKELRAYLDERFTGKMLLAEANQWPEDAAAYFGDGDECHMNFHFPLMPRLFMALRMEDRFPIIDILKQTPEIPEINQWAIFLRNHDELTLEMVTDEERDYMYRVYAHDPQARINLGIRRRLAPLLGNHRRKIELMTSLLLSLPGTPVLYYGDEIGMGDNIYLGDRNGVRTPMQWSGDRNAGFSRANPQRLYLPVITDPAYHYEAVNVEAQQDNPSSLLWWTKRLIALRKQFKAFGRGSLDFIAPNNLKILAYVRRYEGECILVVVNLSRFTQPVWLDLSPFAGSTPIELFGRTAFPVIGEQPYFLTMDPHAFQWFSLESGEYGRDQLRAVAPLRGSIAVEGSWEDVLQGRSRQRIEALLPEFLAARRWFRGKAKSVRGATIADLVPVRYGGGVAYLTLVEVAYREGDGDTYVLPVAFAAGERAAELQRDHEAAVIARVEPAGSEPGVLYDALVDSEFDRALLQLMPDRKRLKGASGELAATSMPELRRNSRELAALEPKLVRAEQSNSSVVYGDELILKVFRRLEDGVSLDYELGRFLTEQQFAHAPAVLGVLEYRGSGVAEPRTLGLLHRFVENEGDAWRYTLDTLARFFEEAAASGAPPEPPSIGTRALVEGAVIPDEGQSVRELIGGYLGMIALLGRRTGELHHALTGAADDKAFGPEPFSTLYQRSIYQSMRNSTGQAFLGLKSGVEHLPERWRPLAHEVLGLEDAILRRFRALIETKLGGMRIRTHGDYHLGQVLFTGKDFIITDFEGEPARPLTERRLKRSPLRDVAGMLRSFHYAAHTVLEEQRSSSAGRDAELLESWARLWYAESAQAFLRGYLETALVGDVIPVDPEDVVLLLDSFLLEKAVYEIAYELNNRPDWVWIPLRGILDLMQS
jgi:maltose alpha-D-glucosyltransferase / alpha-amylase